MHTRGDWDFITSSGFDVHSRTKKVQFSLCLLSGPSVVTAMQCTPPDVLPSAAGPAARWKLQEAIQQRWEQHAEPLRTQSSRSNWCLSSKVSSYTGSWKEWASARKTYPGSKQRGAKPKMGRRHMPLARGNTVLTDVIPAQALAPSCQRILPCPLLRATLQ